MRDLQIGFIEPAFIPRLFMLSVFFKLNASAQLEMNLRLSSSTSQNIFINEAKAINPLLTCGGVEIKNKRSAQ